MSNLDILREAKTTDHKHQKSTVFIFWLQCGKKIEHVMMHGKTYGKRNKGRQRDEILNSLLSWHGRESARELIFAFAHRKMWRSIIAQAR